MELFSIRIQRTFQLVSTENRQIRANNVTDTTFIGLGVITAPTNIATAQRAMMTEKTN